MNHVNDGTSQFLDGAHQSQMAAEKLGELAAQLAARHRALPGLRYRA